jgi:tetratricopeptide (TPR) repeat protein
MLEDNLRLGIEAANQRDLDKAKSYLARAVKENPKSEEGWLWLGRCLTDREQRKYCYERVLRLNPQHVEAQNELDQLFLDNVTETSTPVAEPVSEFPGTPEKEQSKADWKSNPRFLAIMGVIAGLCLCGVPILFLIYSGLLDPLAHYLDLGVTPISTTFVPAPINSVTAIPPENNFFPSATLFVSVDNNLRQSRDLVAQGKYAEAIPLLDQAIQSAPDLDELYFLRAESYHGLMRQQRSQSEYQDYLDKALADIDQAIAIRPDHGDYYMLRQYLLVGLAGLQNYQVDAANISEYALQNAVAALNLGATLDEYPDRIYITDLIFTRRCEEAIQQLQKMIDQTDPNEPSIGGLYHIQSMAYVCAGQVDRALQMVDKSMFNNANMEWKYELKARYLYQAGRSNEAFQLLNKLIGEKPSYDGWRYFLRALIYQEMGEREKAAEDLMMGASNTWEHGGLYAYVQGKMALEDGNMEEGIAMLQEAEATLDYLFTPLQKRIQTELEELGAKPLEITPSVMLDATSIPTIQARPTARALPTPIPQNTPLVTITPTPGISFPYNVNEAIIVDLARGAGKLTLLPNDYPLLRFQPAEPIAVKQVKSLVVHLSSASNETANPDIQIYFWVPRGGGWRYIAPTWGDNPIDQAEDYVLPDGDIFLAIRNWGSQTIEFNNVTLTLVVETQGGAIKTYGQK